MILAHPTCTAMLYQSALWSPPPSSLVWSRQRERASGGEFLSRGRGTREMSYMITSCVTPPQQHTALSQTSQTCAALNGLHQMFGYHNHTKLHTPLDWLIFAHMNKSRLCALVSCWMTGVLCIMCAGWQSAVMHLKALFVPFIDQAIDLVIACLQVWVQCFCLSKCLWYGVICVIITTYLKKLMEEKENDDFQNSKHYRDFTFKQKWEQCPEDKVYFFFFF